MSRERSEPAGAIRLRTAFEQRNARGGAALIPFLAAGDPDVATTIALARAAADAGADIIELGVPYSDPLADGPVIQAAYSRALRAGLRLVDVFACARDAGASTQLPVVLMCSSNMVFARGIEDFCTAAAAAGVAGLIVPDLPLDEAAPLRDVAAAAGLALILLVAPDTPNERAERIARASSGFVYLVRRRGVTGAGAATAETGTRARRLAALGGLPVAVGFGITTVDDARAAAVEADGVIVGSALVELAHRADSTAVGAAVAAMRHAIDSARTPSIAARNRA